MTLDFHTTIGMFGLKILDKEKLMKILILGSTGMLGNAVGKHFLSNPEYQVTTTYRTPDVSYGTSRVKFDVTIDSLEEITTTTGTFDYIINCIGTIKPFMASNPRMARYINSVFPWDLAEWCKKYNQKLIHVTSDCAFSGKSSKYTESSVHDALDDYGKSKSLGEPINDCMVIRTSIIGEEIHKNASLIAWAKSQKGKTVKGYTHHYWNGITTNQYGLICDKIIQNEWYTNGLFHVHAKDDVNKLQMMHYFNNKFKLDLTIESAAPGEPCDRTMRSEKDLCKKLEVPTVEEMINAL